MPASLHIFSMDYHGIIIIHEHRLTGAKCREWMGCWGLLALLLIVLKWIIPENSRRKTHQ
jgi:hypothetical protein